MTIRPFLIIMAGCALQPAIIYAAGVKDRIDLGLEYTTELQTNFKACNWQNLLRLNASIDLGHDLQLQASTISIARSRQDRLVDDMQVFSNIEEENLTLGPALLGLQWAPGNAEFFFGVRNVGEDYFTTPATSLFTNSSGGIFPTISACYDIANYPYSSLGIDFKLRLRSAWMLQASVYNGQGYNHFAGRENVFRFCPASDGVFGITAINYEHRNSYYSLGCALHHGHRGPEGLGSPQALETPKKKTDCAPWLNAEQRLFGPLALLAQASVNFGPNPECKHYEGLGLTADLGRAQPGIHFTHAQFADVAESAVEFTARMQLSSTVFLQPACHVICTGSSTACVAVIRLALSL